jgi:hypothetical protein
MITFQKYLAYLFAVLLMLGLIIFFPSVANNSAIFYQIILLAFLAGDSITTIKTTYTADEGKFKKLKIGRYLFSAITNVLLLGYSAYTTKKYSVDLLPCVTVFASGLFLIVSFFIGTTELNKFFTFSNPGEQLAPPPSIKTEKGKLPPSPEGQ